MRDARHENWWISAVTRISGIKKAASPFRSLQRSQSTKSYKNPIEGKSIQAFPIESHNQFLNLQIIMRILRNVGRNVEGRMWKNVDTH